MQPRLQGANDVGVPGNAAAKAPGATGRELLADDASERPTGPKPDEGLGTAQPGHEGVDVVSERMVGPKGLARQDVATDKDAAGEAVAPVLDFIDDVVGLNAAQPRERILPAGRTKGSADARGGWVVPVQAGPELPRGSQPWLQPGRSVPGDVVDDEAQAQGTTPDCETYLG